MSKEALGNLVDWYKGIYRFSHSRVRIDELTVMDMREGIYGFTDLRTFAGFGYSLVGINIRVRGGLRIGDFSEVCIHGIRRFTKFRIYRRSRVYVHILLPNLGIHRAVFNIQYSV